MAAFLPYVAATLIFDALHLHPFVPDHGPLCRHHISEPPPPVRASSGYECPTCSWQRNLPQQATRTWSPDLVRSSEPVFIVAPAFWRASEDIQPALFRGPPVLPS